MMITKLMSAKNIIYCLFFVIASILTGCIDENPNLVNPPSQAETIRLRFLNLAADQKPRTFVMNSIAETASVPYGTCSPAIAPPADSITAKVSLNGNIDFSMYNKIKFSRESRYTLFGLPTPYNAPKTSNIDTVIILYTVPNTFNDETKAKVTVFNAYPDSTVYYSLTIGCPSGTSLCSGLAYRQSSGEEEIRTGSVAFSLIRYKDTVPTVLGLYQVNLKALGEYILVIKENQGKEELCMIDQYEETVNALTPTIEVPQRSSFFKAVNFSTENVRVQKYFGDVIADDLEPFKISPKADVTVCESNMEDSIVTVYDNQITSVASTSLEVLENYTALVFDSAQKKAAVTVLSTPIRYSIPADNCIIRVVNGNYAYPYITASLGARFNDTAAAKYSSGEVLAATLGFGKMSDAVFIKAGIAPITIFNTLPPTRIIYSNISTLETGKNYLLVFYKNALGSDALCLIEDSQYDVEIEPLTQGVFAQFVHLFSNNQTMTVSTPDVLSNAIVYYGNSLGTVLKEGTQNISFQGVDFQVNAELGKRLLLVAYSDKGNVKMLNFTYDPFQQTADQYMRRFINAAPDVDFLQVRITADDGEIVADNLPFAYASVPGTFTKEGKTSLHFINANTKEVLFKLPEVWLIRGKAYSIIFGGVKGSYSVVIYQEY